MNPADLLRSRVRWLLLAAALLSGGTARVSAQVPVATSDVFERYADRVVKVQVIETGSAAKSGIGSAFFVTPEGHLVTNYHVISELLQSPGRYRAEYVDRGGVARKVEVLAVDVVSDLAVLGTGVRVPQAFALERTAVPQGARLYSLGHPQDLGLSIVEGTYNGPLAHTRHARLHFTGSINPGMSGGPAITADGRVIGINVATAGNQLSFLVPVQQAVALVARALDPAASPARTLEQAGAALRDDQEAWLGDLLTGSPRSITLGPWRVVTEPAPTFRCWADAERQKENPYELVYHRCDTDDDVFLAGEHITGTVSIEHQLLTSRTLNAAQFYALYSARFSGVDPPMGGFEHVTSWRCESRNVRQETTMMRAVLCLRGYRKMDGLYDGLLKVAMLGRRNVGLISTLTVAGASVQNIRQLTTRYLERLQWN